MRFLQLNLNHCEVAQDILKRKDINAWISDMTGGVSIWICGRWPISSHKAGQTTSFVYANVKGMHLYSCYAPPGWDREVFESFLSNLVSDARGKSPMIITGDFNAWAVEWELDLCVANVRAVHTFRRAGVGSAIDVTFVSTTLMERIHGWTVSEHYMGSDHQAIIYEVRAPERLQHVRTRPSVGWRAASFDVDIFRVCLNDVPLGDAQSMIYRTMYNIKTTHDASMPRRRPDGSCRPPVYWWTDGIANLRRRKKAKRRYQRARGRPTFTVLQEAYKQTRRELRLAIKRSKKRCSEELCCEVDGDPWGRPYKTVMSKLKGFRTQSPTSSILLQNIVGTLSPEQHEQPRAMERPGNNEAIPEVSV
ncbi:uncharacterized protein LOC126851886 [Cataglyphis hispanica]|uniref:uncharacterized protein LOC126851886 n=1 Tax=Cataglyphis hispanica TaxID=1086592 RepID=UPI00218055AF|nr:uncharacterized protein LOC126851886 [Cataglyphis hispanica]